MNPEEVITPDDLLNAMDAAGVLDVFSHLPEKARSEFQSWIGKARDNEAHWRRIDSLVLVMRNAPALRDDDEVHPHVEARLDPVVAPIRVRKVLVVDDDPSVRLLIKTFLDGEGAFEWVGEASGCSEAVELAAALQPDLVTMDYSMPGSSGTDCIRMIKTHLPDVQILALTSSDEEVARTMVEAGAYAKIDKGHLEAVMPALYEVADRRTGDRRRGDRRR